jgi:integrase/recombinase XerD
MSSLRTTLDEYLAVRRALGYTLRLPGRLLRRFVEFAEQEGADHITTELALKWATQPAHAQPSQWANRLGMVRRFARYCGPTDPRTVVPPPDLLPHQYRRVAPYLYTDEQILRLLKAARQLPIDDRITTAHLCHALRFIRRHRSAGKRGLASALRRCGPPQRGADDSGE